MADVDLSTIEFFDVFSESDLARISAKGEDVEAEPGAVLTRQGDVGQDAFVIVSGQAAVNVAGTRVATAGPGGMIGEMALLDLRPRSATVVALTDMTLVRFDHHEFQELLELMPDDAVAKLKAKSDETRRHNLGLD